MLPQPRSLRLPSTLICLASIFLSIVSCQSIDQAYYTNDGREIRDIEPAPFKVAIAPLQWGAARPEVESAATIAKIDSGQLELVYNTQQLRQVLLENLEDLQSASAIYAVGEDGLAQARDTGADLYLRPRITSCNFSYKEATPRKWISWGLWLSTWIGGTFVDDSRYLADLSVDWEIYNPHDGLLLDLITTASLKQDLSFWERNGASYGTLQSIILPPFWTTDDAKITSQSLSDHASGRIAALLASYLKQDLLEKERRLLGELRISSPRNGSQVEAVMTVIGRISANAPIGQLSIYLNQSAEPIFVQKETDATTQRRGNLFIVPIKAELQLNSGQQHIVFEYSVGGSVTTRTLVVNCKKQEKEENQ